MGKSRSYEIIDDRKKIIRLLVNSPEIVKLLGEEGTEYPEEVIPYKWVFPTEYIPEAITKTERFINFEIRASANSQNEVYKKLTIYFFVVCHEDVMRYWEDGRDCLWFDKVTCELDEIFSNQDIFGVGRMKLVDNAPYCPQTRFKGRLLTFQSLDWTNGAKYGK